MDSKSVYVSTVLTGCCKKEFDFSYPDELNGIISQKEFQRSITRINRSLSPDKNFAIFTIIFYLITIVGIVFSYVSIILLVNNPKDDVFLSLSIVGIILTFLGSILFIFGKAKIKKRRTAQLLQTVTEVSMKYSERSSAQCDWVFEPPVSLFDCQGDCSVDNLSDRILIRINRPKCSRSEQPHVYQYIDESTLPSAPQRDDAPPTYSSVEHGYYGLPETLTPLGSSPSGPGINQHGVF